MQKILFMAGLVLSMSRLFGQTEKAVYKTAANKFETYYNAASYDSIYALFSDKMKGALSFDKLSDFLTDLHSSAGKITKRVFTNYEKSYAAYRTNFERALFTVLISVDDNADINGLFVKPYADETAPKPARNTTRLALPFKGEWTVFWGGDTKEQNYHVDVEAQKNAFDIIVTDARGKSYKTNGEKNEDYYVFGKELFAPCDGEVVLVVDGIKDNVPGVLNPMYVPGNSVIIKTVNNEYLFFAHFKQRTIKVVQGQKVKQGQLLGLCGNSGNSSEPHLHFHIQNVEDINVATGVKCYFEKLVVNGQVKTDYSPVKGEKIKTLDK